MVAATRRVFHALFLSAAVLLLLLMRSRPTVAAFLGQQQHRNSRGVIAAAGKLAVAKGLQQQHLQQPSRQRPIRTLCGGSVIMTTLDASASSSMTNQELAARRLRKSQAKNQETQEMRQQMHRRNYHLKTVLPKIDPRELYQVKVTVCDELRNEMRLSGREKRGRVFLERTGNDAITSIRSLKRELHGFFRALRKDTYLLSGTYPIVQDDGTITAAASSSNDPSNDSTSSTTPIWKIETDDDVRETFAKADAFFQENDNLLKRPAIVIHVQKDPNAPATPPPPEYLQSMVDPSETTHMSMLSFYSFPVSGIRDPDALALQLRKLWKPFHVLGRVYVANEGVNAQMAVPTNVLDNFIACCHELPEGVGEYLQTLDGDGVNVDPVPLSVEEFAEAGVPATAGKPAPPFKNLHIRVRQQVVTDGLDQSYDWQQAGYDMPPLEWHERLKEEKERREKGATASNDPAVTLLDCRNNYETDVGIFDGAEPLNTLNFRDSWDALKDRLADTPKDAPIMTYCTGGIRCVKVGAFLTQELGFTNVSRLAGGIIAYDRTLTEKAPEEKPLFKGTNFVFDGRLGRSITEDELGQCITCGASTSLVSNCRNGNCHKRIIQCENCRTSFQGTCSDACKNRLINGSMRPRRNSDASSDTSERQAAQENLIFATLDEYSLGHSSPPPSIYAEMELNTRALIPTGSHMVSSSSQGRLLTQLASMTREGRILELGTFSGYATASLVEGALNAAHSLDTGVLGTREKGPFVMSMERDAKAFHVAVAQLRIIEEYGTGEPAAEAMCALRSHKEVPCVAGEAVSLEYENLVTCELRRVSDALANVEELAAGRGDSQLAPFDMVFLDADKTRLLEYVEAFLSSDRVLKKGGIVVVDNVLWKGLVLDASSGDFSSIQDLPNAEDSELRKNKRARKLANKMHFFNSEIVKDDRVEVLLLPMRDGLSVIRKK